MCKLFVAPDDLEEMARTADRRGCREQPMEFDSWKEAGFVKGTDVENPMDAAGVPKKVLSLDLLQSWRVDIWVRTADWALAFLGCWVVGLLAGPQEKKSLNKYQTVMSL